MFVLNQTSVVMITRNNTYTEPQFRLSEIFNFQTGKIERADFWLKQNLEVVHQLKSSIKNQEKSYGCPICKTPLILKVGEKKHAHFAHAKREEGVECILCEDNKLTEIQRKIQRYNYAKEREQHKKLKQFLSNYLQNHKNIKKVSLEKITSSAVTACQWQKADIEYTYKGNIIAIDIQTNDTLNEALIQERNTFYQKKKRPHLRVYDRFPAYLRSADSLNFSQNIFVLDEPAQKRTDSTDVLHLNCYSYQPVANPKTKTIEKQWASELVSIEHLRFNENNYAAYHVSYKEKQAEAEQRLLKIKQAHNQHNDLMNIPGYSNHNFTQPLPSKYEQMTETQIIRLIFENKLSRTLVNLKNRIAELVFDEGYAIPQNLIDILEAKGCIQRIHANTSQIHYQKMVFES